MADRPIRIKVRALKDGLYGDMRYFPAWSKDGRNPGAVFVVGLDACPHDEEGRLLIRPDKTPVMPRWMEPVEALPKIDTEKIECVVASAEFLKKWKPYEKPRETAGAAAQEAEDGAGDESEMAVAAEAPAKGKMPSRRVI
jgi:hypothetical protein